MNRSDRLMLRLLAVLVIASVAFSYATGRLNPIYVADSPSYLTYPFGSLEQALLSQRTPGYPVFLKVIEGTIGIQWTPLVQCIIGCVAAWLFAVELSRWGAGRLATWASAMAIVCSCTFMDNQSTISTDAIAASVGVVTAATILRWVRLGQTTICGLSVIVLTVVAVMLRPAYLALIVWVTVAGSALTRPTRVSVPNQPRRFGHRVIVAASLSIAATSVLIAWMMLRLVVVDDFGLLPFGHQNLSGITVQLVSDEELTELPQQCQSLVKEFLNRKSQAEVRGYDFTSGDGSATMTIESRWNDLIYQAMIPAAKNVDPNDPVEQHRAVGRLNKAILLKYPDRYLRWLLLAVRRAAWGTAANIVMNPIFLTALMCWTLYWLTCVIMRQSWRSTTNRYFDLSPATSALFVLAWSYAIVMIGFVILTSPPLGRFADAGAIFIPAWLASRLADWTATDRDIGNMVSDTSQAPRQPVP